MTKTKTLVEFRAVHKTYDGSAAVVQALNLEIHEGEFLTLLGPSGSGKTTCLIMLAGFESPTSGQIFFDQQPLTHTPPHQRNIGMVFQNYALFPHLSVAENLAFPLQLRGMSKAEIALKVKEALAMVQLDDFGRRFPAQLSGGQQQRVALARALIFSPRLVLMDEPLGALDKQLREHMQLEIKHLHASLGLTVVYVTHDQSEALTMSDRVAVFHQGKIQQLASPSALYETPETAFVAQFIGENNQLEAKVIRHEGSRVQVQTKAGDLFDAQAIGEGFAVGSAVVMTIRPERLQLAPAATDGLNRLTTTITELIYLGDHLKLLTRAGLVIKQAVSAIHTPYQVGQSIELGFLAEHARAFHAT